MPIQPSIVWLRSDLRVDDNPALLAAAARGGPVVPAFIWSPHEDGAWPPGAASRWWLHQSLASLQRDLQKLGAPLVIRNASRSNGGGAARAASALDELRKLIAETGADAVYWNRRYEPAAIRRDTQIKSALRADGLTVESFNAALLFEPTVIRTQAGQPYTVYTPFSKACFAAGDPPEPRPAPRKLRGCAPAPRSETLESLQLEPGIDWAAGFREAWSPGERGAQQRLVDFLEGPLGAYAGDRNRPDLPGSSRLSPHLRFGEISPSQVWHAVRSRMAAQRRDTAFSGNAEVYLKELLWREFAHHLLVHFPHTTDEPLRENFARFPWRRDPSALRAWQRGRTGYPIVDAGMRELWSTGWMHNRVRMIVASFLCKDLLLPWQDGARWFWDTLVDADLANNTLGWQWTAGCGADAAPYFRIFNPVSQGMKFDPNGDYVRRWCPELANLPASCIHAPWEASAAECDRAGVAPGRDYPDRIVDHAAARERALAAFAAIKVTKA